MKGDITPYIKEITEFFATKHLDVDVISEEFNTHSYKSQQCKISIVLKEKEMERRALGINPVYMIVTLAHFELIAMPGCCGIIISTSAWVLHKIQGYGIGQWLHNLRLKIAKEWGYGVIMCTDVATNKPQKHILQKNNWKDIHNFANPRTGNSVDITIHNI